MSWFCKCGIKNTGIATQCAMLSVKDDRFGTEHYQVSNNTPDFLMALIAARELNIMTPQEELYAQFYNKGKILVKDMDLTQLREHRESLAQIAFEAKATLAAADDELRERKAKSSKKEWTITPTGPDQVTSDAINAVKVRKERMTKMDKMRADLLKAGIDEETVKEMISTLERKATASNLKTVTFNKPTVEVAAVQVQEKKEPENGSPAPAFNPASLVFGK